MLFRLTIECLIFILILCDLIFGHFDLNLALTLSNRLISRVQTPYLSFSPLEFHIRLDRK